MKSFFKTLFASMLGTFLGLALLLLVAIGIIAVIASSSKENVEVKEGSVLVFDLSGNLPDRSENNPFEALQNGKFGDGKKLGLDDVLQALERAKKDEKIKGIYINLKGVGYGMANLAEVRDKLLSFKESGKFIIAYSDFYSQGAYTLASVADTIYLNPQGMVDIHGLSAQLMFFKGALEKMEIRPEVIRHGKFKSAVEPFIAEKMSDENRIQTSKFLNSMWSYMLTKISASRNINISDLQMIADELKLRKAKDALDNKLVDKLAYESDVLEILKNITQAKSTKDIKKVSISEYSDSTDEDKEYSKDKVAVIYAQGEIVDGNGESGEIGGNSLAKTIREAAENEKVKAIVLRVNSPGGSALASEIIWKEISNAKTKKPVIASMGNVAASGGYYISCLADTIVASETTVTGSIGVFGLFFTMQDLFKNKLGITMDTVNTAKYADFMSLFRPLSEFERAAIQEGVEDVYDVFTKRVAEGRKMTQANVDSIGQGRVWAGKDAKEIGLVDAIGGLDFAIELAAKKAKLEKYGILKLPKQKSPIEEIFSGMNASVQAKFFASEFGEHAEKISTVKKLAKKRGILALLPYDFETN